MHISDAVSEVWNRFCEGVTRGAVEEFDDLVSQEANIVVGTAPGEVITDRPAMRFGFEAEGVSLKAGEVQGFEEGSMGWAFDQPTFGLPDGSTFACRVTAVMRREDETWRLVHAHFSVGVPDEEVVDLQRRWSAEKVAD